MTTQRESNRWLRDHHVKTYNTEVRFHDGRIIVRLHSTDIVDVDTKNNSITLRTGGWETVTTKERMNAVLRAFKSPYHVYQHKYEWYVASYAQEFPFNGIFTLPLREVN